MGSLLTIMLGASRACGTKVTNSGRLQAHDKDMLSGTHDGRERVVETIWQNDMAVPILYKGLIEVQKILLIVTRPSHFFASVLL
jgi:hypothetical protein